MEYINNNVIFVQGVTNGAIYDLDRELVYSINKKSCLVLNKVIKKSDINSNEKKYLQLLIKNGLFNDIYIGKKYFSDKDFSMKLNTVWLEVTLNCNCKCIHCYQGKNHTSHKDTLSLKEWKIIIKELHELKAEKVIVIGGEPCLNRNLSEILNYLCDMKIKTTLFTNGTLLNNEIKKTIIENKKMLRVKMSMYGHNSFIHDSITKKEGSFKKLLDSIYFLKEHDIEVDIAVIKMKENQNFMDNIQNLIVDLGLDYYGFDIIRTVEGGEQAYHIPDEKRTKHLDSTHSMDFYTSHNSFRDNMYKNSCWYGKLAITETGNVFPCVFERNRLYGNIKNSSIKNILESSDVKKMWFLDFSKIEVCKDCEFRFSCKDCRPLAISTRGIITDKNPRCKYNPYTGEWSD